jgi:hypothetical protein
MPAAKIAIFDEPEGFIKQFVSLTRKTRDYIGCDGSSRTFRLIISRTRLNLSWFIGRRINLRIASDPLCKGM